MDILTGRLGPREIALAFAFGILLGLVPKANLLFFALLILVFLSHANFGITLIVGVVVSFFAPWVHPTAHEIGGTVLLSPIGQQIGAKLFQIPGVPWTMLDNTVVLGSFLIGLVLFFPVYFFVWAPLKLVWPRPKPKTPPAPSPAK